MPNYPSWFWWPYWDPNRGSLSAWPHMHLTECSQFQKHTIRPNISNIFPSFFDTLIESYVLVVMLGPTAWTGWCRVPACRKWLHCVTTHYNKVTAGFRATPFSPKKRRGVHDVGQTPLCHNDSDSQTLQKGNHREWFRQWGQPENNYTILYWPSVYWEYLNPPPKKKTQPNSTWGDRNEEQTKRPKPVTTYHNHRCEWGFTEISHQIRNSRSLQGFVPYPSNLLALLWSQHFVVFHFVAVLADWTLWYPAADPVRSKEQNTWLSVETG